MMKQIIFICLFKVPFIHGASATTSKNTFKIYVADTRVMVLTDPLPFRAPRMILIVVSGTPFLKNFLKV